MLPLTLGSWHCTPHPSKPENGTLWRFKLGKEEKNKIIKMSFKF